MILPPPERRRAKATRQMYRQSVSQLRVSSFSIVGRFSETPMASGTDALQQLYRGYGSPSFHKNIHRECACIASNCNIFICREDTDTDEHTHTRRHRIHWPISGEICAQSRT